MIDNEEEVGYVLLQENAYNDKVSIIEIFYFACYI